MYGLDYRLFLNTVSKYFEIRKVRDYARPAEGKVCLLRHDVDSDINQAIKMAEIEYEAEVRSTYFVLHTAGYYKESRFLDKCRYLQDMGHEVGLHNNIITATLGEPSATTEEILARELAFLRGGGVDVRGTVSHGDNLCHELNFLNYQIFKGCVGKNRPDSVKGIKFYTIDMADHDLDYEALFVERHSYLSDSGGSRWSWNYPKKAEPIESYRESQDVIAYVNKLGMVEGRLILQILAHPIWWSL